MPRIRTIKPELAFDEELAFLPLEAQKFYILLWTHCDKAGRCEDRPVKLRALIYPYHPKIDGDRILRALHPKFVYRYQANGKKYLQVRNWKKHQRPLPQEQDSLIPPPADLKEGNTEGLPKLNHGDTKDAMEGNGTEGKGKEWIKRPLGSQDQREVERLLNLRYPIHGDHHGVHIINLDPEYCRWALKNLKALGSELKRALELRVELKESEKREDARK